MLSTSWKDLRNRFLTMLENPAASGLDVWLLVVDHPWFQQMLLAQARRSLPTGWSWAEPIVDDLTQHVQFQLFVKMRRERSMGFDRTRAAFKSWLERIVYNDCLDFWRRERRQPVARPSTISLDRCPETILSQRADREARIDVWRLLDCLPPQDAAILKLYATGHTLRETAERLGVSLHTVRKGREQALQRLRQLLGPSND